MVGLTLLDEARAAGLTVLADGDRLVVRGPRAAEAVARRLLEHKTAVLAALAPQVVESQAALDAQQDLVAVPEPAAGRDDHGGQGGTIEVIEPFPPCPRCNSLELWQTLAGNWRCLRCDPPTTAIRVLEHVKRIRQRLKMPARSETAELVADLRRLTSPISQPAPVPGASTERGSDAR